MDTDRFELKVVTPTGLILEEIVTEAQVPASDGEIGILPQHCRYTGLLGSGTLKFREAGNGELRQLTLSGGFCTFADDTLTILADEAQQAA